jgi:molybdopterin converting factor small subunit
MSKAMAEPEVETTLTAREATIQITIRLLANYSRYLAEGQRAQAGYVQQISPGTRVGDVLAGLPIPAGEVCTFFVNGRHAERGQALQEGDVLSVFPAAGGG